MSNSRRVPLSPKRRTAYLAIGLATVLVVAALVADRPIFVAIAAVATVVLAGIAVGCLVREVLDTRLAAAADALATSVDYGRLSTERAAEHLAELRRLEARLTTARASNVTLQAECGRLSDMVADLHLTAARLRAERADHADRAERAEVESLPPVIQLPVAPTVDRRAAGDGERRHA